MPTPRNRTKRDSIKPLGVAERLADAPPTHYVPTGSNRPGPADTYTMPDGETHRWDGRCHETCENLR